MAQVFITISLIDSFAGENFSAKTYRPQKRFSPFSMNAAKNFLYLTGQVRQEEVQLMNDNEADVVHIWKVLNRSERVFTVPIYSREWMPYQMWQWCFTWHQLQTVLHTIAALHWVSFWLRAYKAINHWLAINIHRDGNHKVKCINFNCQGSLI